MGRVQQSVHRERRALSIPSVAPRAPFGTPAPLFRRTPLIVCWVQANGPGSLRSKAIMSDMGTFRTTIMIENPLRRGELRTLTDTLVDTGAELAWAPRAVLESLGITRQKTLGFRTADGRAVSRDVGYAIVQAG